MFFWFKQDTWCYTLQLVNGCHGRKLTQVAHWHFMHPNLKPREMLCSSPWKGTSQSPWFPFALPLPLSRVEKTWKQWVTGSSYSIQELFTGQLILFCLKWLPLRRTRGSQGCFTQLTDLMPLLFQEACRAQEIWKANKTNPPQRNLLTNPIRAIWAQRTQSSLTVKETSMLHQTIYYEVWVPLLKQRDSIRLLEVFPTVSIQVFYYFFCFLCSAIFQADHPLGTSCKRRPSLDETFETHS